MKSRFDDNPLKFQVVCPQKRGSGSVRAKSGITLHFFRVIAHMGCNIAFQKTLSPGGDPNATVVGLFTALFRHGKSSPFRAAILIWGQTYFEFEWFVPKTGLRF